MDKKKKSGKSFEKLAIGELGQKTLNYPSKSRGGAKLFSLFLSLLVNAGILLVLMLISISVFRQEVVELVFESGSNETKFENNKKSFQILKKQKPQPANASAASPVISAVNFSNNAVFAIEDNGALQNFGIGDGWGKGADFGSGQKGGSVGFFGSRSVAEDEQSVKNRTHTVVHDGKEYIWNTQGGASRYYIESREDLYSSSWISASQRNIRKTISRVELVKKSFGTDWRHPLKMALNMNPSPDVVYFLTDGVVGNGQQAVDEVIKMNKRGPKAKIFTISMMQPKAEDLLKDLADRSGGDFSIVLQNGEVEKMTKKK